jgi:hypothetical protein
MEVAAERGAAVLGTGLVGQLRLRPHALRGWCLVVVVLGKLPGHAAGTMLYYYIVWPDHHGVCCQRWEVDWCWQCECSVLSVCSVSE